MPTYRAALLGLGNIAWRFDDGPGEGPARTHLGAFRHHGGIDVVCGYSPLEADRQAFESRTGIRAVKDLNDVWALGPDIVSICSPSEFHFQQTAGCLRQRVPMVWLEKPPTLSLADLDALIDAQHSGPTTVAVNYMRRYSPTYRRLAQICREGILGRPLALQVLYSRGLETNGSHFLDVMFLMRNEVPVAELTISAAERRVDSPSFGLRFEDGFVASFSGHHTSFHINDVILTCEHGRVSVLSGGTGVRVERKAPNPKFPGFFCLSEDSAGDLFPPDSDDAFSTALADLVSAHVSGLQPASNLRTARQTQALIDEIRRP